MGKPAVKVSLPIQSIFGPQRVKDSTRLHTMKEKDNRVTAIMEKDLGLLLDFGNT